MTWLRLKPDFVKYNYMKCMIYKYTDFKGFSENC